MESTGDIKAVYVIVNAGFADDVVSVMREAGAGGATIINARGEGSAHKSILGITVDSEKEMVVSLADAATAERMLDLMKAKEGIKTPARGVCFVMPVDKVVGLSRVAPLPGAQ